VVRSVGADHVIDYTREDVTDGGRRYDVIIDTGGNRPLRLLRRALTPHGTLVIVGAETGGRWFGGLGRVVKAPLLSPVVGQTLRPLANSENASDLRVLAELAESGKLTPAIERTYPLREAPAAIQRMVDGRVRGKVVVRV
jgi:NADPH:quinone reductase-like Zn-dependent oxidoreductase